MEICLIIELRRTGHPPVRNDWIAEVTSCLGELANERQTTVSKMKAQLLVRRRLAIAADAFVEVVIWQVPAPVLPSTHPFKYRLAYIVDDRCVLRYDNERGKGDHRHSETAEEPYVFLTPDRLMSDFEADVARWNHENRHP